MMGGGRYGLGCRFFGIMGLYFFWGWRVVVECVLLRGC